MHLIPSRLLPALLAGFFLAMPVAMAEQATSAFPAEFSKLLEKYATSKGVRYAAWHANAGDVAKLGEVVRFYETTTPPAATQDSLAWHLNAYNAWILQQILKKYPTKGPLDKDPLFFHAARIVISGKKVSFDTLEQKMIRPIFKEPRIHFALNCASKSCPPLHTAPFDGATLDAVLTQLTKTFINENPEAIQMAGSTARISKLFEWYADDFGGKGKQLAYINGFRNTKIPPNAKVQFLEYDWALNSVD